MKNEPTSTEAIHQPSKVEHWQPAVIYHNQRKSILVSWTDMTATVWPFQSDHGGSVCVCQGWANRQTYNGCQYSSGSTSSITFQWPNNTQQTACILLNDRTDIETLKLITSLLVCWVCVLMWKVVNHMITRFSSGWNICRL